MTEILPKGSANISAGWACERRDAGAIAGDVDSSNDMQVGEPAMRRTETSALRLGAYGADVVLACEPAPALAFVRSKAASLARQVSASEGLFHAS